MEKRLPCELLGGCDDVVMAVGEGSEVECTVSDGTIVVEVVRRQMV